MIHFAGLKAVGESVVKPMRYFDNNLIGTINLYEIMAKYNCRKVSPSRFSIDSTFKFLFFHLKLTRAQTGNSNTLFLNISFPFSDRGATITSSFEFLSFILRWSSRHLQQFTDNLKKFLVLRISS